MRPGIPGPGSVATVAGPQAPPRPRVPVDPRIRQRRVEVQRSEGRRRRRILLAIVAALAVLGAGWGVTRSPLLDVDRVTVEGADRSGHQAVVTAAGIRRGRAMVDVDDEAAASRVATLPWVLSATVTRAWPSTVRIRVTERAAIAVARDDVGSWAVLDVSGRVLERVPEAPPDLPVLEGVPAAGAPGTRLGPDAGAPLLVAAGLGPHLGARTAAVTVVADGVELRLRPAGTVALGAPEALQKKLTAVRTVLAAVDPRTVATLDVRLPAAPVLTRR